MDRLKSRQPANMNCCGCRACHELCSNYLYCMLYIDSPGGGTDAVVRHLSFVQITF